MPFDHSTPRFVSSAAFDRLRRASEGLPKIAFAGEFSAGKSTLLNAFLGRAVLPMRATSTALPPVWMHYGDEAACWEDAAGGRHPIAVEDLDKVPSDSRCVHIWLRCEVLSHAELIDLPGISDPNRHDGPIHTMLRLAHMVVWCTPATQAWRQSEYSTWLMMPPRLRMHSVLAVTRADHLTNARDQERVLRRMRSETAGLFADHVLVDAKSLKAQGPDHPLALAIEAQIGALQQLRAARLKRYQTEAAPLSLPEAVAAVEALAGDEPAAEPEPRVEEVVEAAPPLDLLLLTDPIAAQIEAAPVASQDIAVDAEAPPALDPSLDDLVIARISESLASWDDMPELGAAGSEPIGPDAELAPAAAQAPPMPEAIASEAPVPEVPRELRIWRALVAAADLTPENQQMAALFDAYINALLREAGDTEAER